MSLLARMAIRLLTSPEAAVDGFSKTLQTVSRECCSVDERWRPLHAAQSENWDMCEQLSSGSRRRALRIAVVDDEVSVRRFAVRILAAAGYEVVAFGASLEALDFLERSGQRVDLLLTDVVMPEMDGRELAERVHALIPAAAVLLMSGFDPQTAGASVAVADWPLLPKPFTPAQLTQAVARVLKRERL